uniref:Uncharacterized protein n=1 Tax=Oryzias sinensis TaxID=183150 RepID=A0A8C8DIA5_9TELE
MLLYVSNPAQSLPSALALLAHFGSFSSYKGNISKSELFPVNEAARNPDFSSFTLKVECSRFTYLGVTVTQKYKDLFKEYCFRHCQKTLYSLCITPGTTCYTA